MLFGEFTTTLHFLMEAPIGLAAAHDVANPIGASVQNDKEGANSSDINV